MPQVLVHLRLSINKVFYIVFAYSLAKGYEDFYNDCKYNSYNEARIQYHQTHVQDAARGRSVCRVTAFIILSCILCDKLC